MKCVLLSVRPQYVAKILNSKKTIEVRKRFPKDYVGWVYIYCTKESDLFKSYIRMGYYTTRSTADDIEYNGKGKVVARFWCDKVEQVLWRNPRDDEHIPYLKSCDLLKCACLWQDEFEEYVGDSESYAIHITKLEIFDKPKELSDFTVVSHKVSGIDKQGKKKTFTILKPLTKAPQSYMYLEYGQD